MKDTINLLIRYLKRDKAKLIYLLFFLITLVVSSIAIPLLIGMSIDKMIDVHNVKFDELKTIIILILITVFVKVASTLIGNLLQEKIFCNFVKDIRDDLFNKVLYMDMKTFENYSTGDILSRIINDVDNISNVLRQGLSNFLVGSVTILSTLVVIMFFSFKLALILILFTPIGLFMTKFISYKSHNYFQKTIYLRSKLYSFTDELVDTFKERKSFDTKDSDAQEFSDLQDNLYKTGIMGQFFSSLPNPTMRFINATIYLIVALFCSYLVINKNISIGLMVAFLKYTNQYVEPFNDITQVLTQFQSAVVCLERIKDVLDKKEEVDLGDAKVNRLNGSIILKNVSFSYGKNRFIENMNIEIKEKSKVAIVGKTGCGKSTLINIIMGVYNIDSGEILFDGVDIKKISKESFRDNISFVLQDTFIMKGSVKENIKYGRNCTDAEVVEAAKIAFAHEFISMLPHGYDTLLEENGANLSQGEKQLICIARAMIKMPSIVILDEATSDIDMRSEILIRKALDNMLSDRTSIMITHRISTIKNSDLIIVMNGGKIVETGNHGELMQKKGEYYNLYRSYYE